MARLFHIFEVNGRYIIFSPGASSYTLTPEQLNQLLKALYNKPQTITDLEHLHIHRHFYGTLPEEYKAYATKKLSDDEWARSHSDRE